MKALSINKILIPTDFAETELLVVKYAAFLARLNKADLFLLHSVEADSARDILANDDSEIKKIAGRQLHSGVNNNRNMF